MSPVSPLAKKHQDKAIESADTTNVAAVPAAGQSTILVIPCELCRLSGLSCDNGHPCASCTSAKVTCYRRRCRHFFKPSAAYGPGCVSAHQGLSIGGVLSAKDIKALNLVNVQTESGGL